MLEKSGLRACVRAWSSCSSTWISGVSPRWGRQVKGRIRPSVAFSSFSRPRRMCAEGEERQGCIQRRFGEGNAV